jgi:MinD superfamily P-loop ATPase
MKQLLILSGKGGTGKTTIAAAFIRLSEAKAYADCDVDAPNLHLVMNHPEEPKRTDYFGLLKASIDTSLCIACGRCDMYCRFDAINAEPYYHVDPFACEGCGVCEAVCPAGAVTMKPAAAGELMLYTGGNQVFSTAQLKMGSGTTGKLVTEVKKQLKEAAGAADLAVIDGSPGIGCPVIASVSGVHLVLIVAEPSLSGISDMERIVKTAMTFRTKLAVCINKYDINPENSEKIERFCSENGLPFVGKVPFDSSAVRAVNNGKTIVDIDCSSGRAVRAVYDQVKEMLFGKGGHRP